ncbi:hypothetical protein GGX14DRAFT_437690 [Mycena pura]|uniref:Uncharacterized protein n=1 Tax=Mycena pura TaxID=153505 RepID=A0AAD6VRH5_9AGAR|nr:hypothetical protein GGX14DRAFT_437690 [Mycena pura]
MLWTSKRRKSRPDIHPKSPQSQPHRRSSLGSQRLPFAPLDPHQAKDMPDPQSLYARQILSPDEQNRGALQNDSPSSAIMPSSSPRDARDTADMMYTTNSLASFAFGSATEPPPSPRNIGPLDEVDEDDLHRRADDTPRQSLASTARGGHREPRTASPLYAPSRSDAASHRTFGGSSSSLSSPSRSGSRSRTTSSTTHTSVEDLGGVVFNPLHHHPTLPPEVEFDSEEELSEEYDTIEVSSARGAGSMENAAFEAALERQMYADSLTGRRPSLPMAIPGISPDNVSSRREREGSFATLRRPSRSLDDQVSVLSLSSQRDNSPVPGPPSAAPVSVPETDGDWRSLSLRAASRGPPSPSHSTLPTFAPPASTGGGFDGFGFDLDWNEMQAGITTIDMSDIAIAVHERARASGERRPSQLSLMLRRPSTASGGSVMQDPDTFLLAVRGWGGDEYERQRKHWTFRRDTADGRGGTGKMRGVAASAGLSPVRSITSGRVGSIHSASFIERPKLVPWRGMALNSEEIWNSTLVGGFKVRRIELRPQKPQQRVTIDPFRGPYTLGKKPPHDGAYTNIHKHSKVMAFSIHRHYKPTRTPPDPRYSISGGRGSVSGAHLTSGGASANGNGTRGSVNGAAGRGAAAGGGYEERRRPTAMILLAPRHVQEAYTSTNTTKGLRSHGLLNEERERDRDRERSTGRGERSTGRGERSTGRGDARRREKEKEKEKARQNGRHSSNSSKEQRQQSSTGSSGSATSSTSTYHEVPQAHSYSPSVNADPNIGASFAPRSASASRRRRRRDSLDLENSDSETERQRSRTTHNEAFSTMDANSIDQMVQAQDARGDVANGLVARVLRRTPAVPPPAAPHQVYIPPWVTLQSRNKQEERRRRHDVLSNSFEDVGLLPPKKSGGGGRAKKAAASGVDIFAQVHPDALFMLLPLWPGPTDPVSERAAARQPHEIPPEQRQYLLVSYNPTDERPPAKRHDGGDGSSRKNRSTHSSPTSSADASGSGRGCDILLTSYHVSARLVSHQDLQGSGVRVPDEGLAVLGQWDEAWRSMPQIATRDHGLLVIGRCASREAGIEFDPEGLVKMGLCIPVPPEPGLGADEEPVAELTPIGRAVLEMAWIGCIAVTSFGPAGAAS